MIMPANLKETDDSSSLQHASQDSNENTRNFEEYSGNDERTTLLGGRSSSGGDGGSGGTGRGDQAYGYKTSPDTRECIDTTYKPDADKTQKRSPSSGPLQSISARDARLWIIARCLGYASFLLLLALGIFCFVEANRSESSSVFAFAFSCILDSSGAAIVIWRSFSTDSPDKSRMRELQAQVFIGCLFWVASVFILVRALLYLAELGEQDEKESQFLYILLGIGGGLQLFFFVTKTPIAVVLHSPALIADGVNSIAACILASAGIAASVIGESSESLAIADDLVGVLVSFLIAGYGSYLLFQVWTDPRAPEVFGIQEGACHSRCCCKSRKDAVHSDYDDEINEESRLLPSSDTP